MKLKALIVGFVVFQLLYFPFKPNSFGLLTIPTFGSIGFLLTITTAVIVALLSFSFKRNDRKTAYAKASLVISFAFAFASIFRANFADRIILSLGSIGWGMISLYLVTLNSNRFGSLGETLLLPVNVSLGIFNSSKRLLNKTARYAIDNNKPRGNISKFALGIIITAPVTTALLMLLSIADPIFGHYTKRIFSLGFFRSEVFWNLVGRIIFSTIGLGIIAGVIYFKNHNHPHSPLSQVKNESNNLLFPFLMLSAVVSIILVLFLFIQFRYLFLLQNLTDLTSYGIYAFSDYVKRGFAELLLATAIIYGICGIGLVLYRNFKPGKLYLGINTFLVALNFVLSASVLRRVYLYMDAHGLTNTRYYGTAILMVIMLFLITMFIRYFKRCNNLYLIEILGTSIIFFVFAIANNDYLIGKYAPPTVNGQIDRNYIANSSPDGYKNWSEIIQIAQDDAVLISQTPYGLNEKISIVRSYWAISQINRHFERLSAIYEKPNFETFKHFNLAEYNAYKNLKQSFNANEIQALQKTFEPTARYLIQNQEIPRDVYQYLY